ncbi:hypothetical protein [Rheinheimera sp.]|uniref:hypothetical protein n=1 Tax=Rheinheimera sp. TaxID=1869214 RepID=UPI00307E5D85
MHHASENTVQQAAAELARYRLAKQQAAVLPDELRPATSLAAIQIQLQLLHQLMQPVWGWKAGLPSEKGWVMAPIGRLQKGPQCNFEWPASEYSIEPEFAFVLGQDLPPRDDPYSEAEIDAAVAATHLALELIIRPYASDAGAEFLDNLAAGLFNQGLYLGPEVAASPAEVVFTLTVKGQAPLQFAGKHPNADAKAPLYWLVNQLSQLGIGLFQGQAIITGSYAGVWTIPAATPVRIDYQQLGSMQLTALP